MKSKRIVISLLAIFFLFGGIYLYRYIEKLSGWNTDTHSYTDVGTIEINCGITLSSVFVDGALSAFRAGGKNIFLLETGAPRIGFRHIKLILVLRQDDGTIEREYFNVKLKSGRQIKVESKIKNNFKRRPSTTMFA
jgi:hypothetical protein